MLSPSPPGVGFTPFSSVSLLYMLLVHQPLISYSHNQCIYPSINHLCMYNTIYLMAPKYRSCDAGNQGTPQKSVTLLSGKCIGSRLIIGLYFFSCHCDKISRQEQGTGEFMFAHSLRVQTTTTGKFWQQEFEEVGHSAATARKQGAMNTQLASSFWNSPGPKPRE